MPLHHLIPNAAVVKIIRGPHVRGHHDGKSETFDYCTTNANLPSLSNSCDH